MKAIIKFSIFSYILLFNNYILGQTIQFNHSLNGNLLIKEIQLDHKEFIIEGENIICKGDQAQYSISINELALWSNGTNGNASLFTITGDTVIKAIVTNQYGCTFEQTKYIEAADLPTKPIIVRTGDSLTVHNVTGNFEWYRNGQLFSVGLNFIRTSLAGDYTVKVIDSNGCENISEIFTFILVSTIDGVTVNIQAFPNPTTGIMWLQNIDSLNEKYKLSLNSLNGKEYPILLSGNQTDLSSFPNGIYILTLQSNTHVHSIKVIKFE